MGGLGMDGWMGGWVGGAVGSLALKLGSGYPAGGGGGEGRICESM